MPCSPTLSCYAILCLHTTLLPADCSLLLYRQVPALHAHQGHLPPRTQVIAVENELKQQQSRQDLAALLRSIQEHERSKLQLTMSLHALRQAHREQMFTWQNPPDPAADADAVGNEPAVHSHAGHRPGCIGCSEQTCSNPAQKVTRAEYEAAVGEAQLQLDNTVRGINEVRGLPGVLPGWVRPLLLTHWHCCAWEGRLSVAPVPGIAAASSSGAACLYRLPSGSAQACDPCTMRAALLRMPVNTHCTRVQHCYIPCLLSTAPPPLPHCRSLRSCAMQWRS